MNTRSSQHKLIDATRLLDARIPEPKTEYQHGWNDALTTAYEEETGLILIEERKEYAD